MTLGVRPTRPATEYGYLVPEPLQGRVIGGLPAHRLQAFEEKPTEHRARELVEMAGVVVERRDVPVAATARSAPHSRSTPRCRC